MRIVSFTAVIVAATFLAKPLKAQENQPTSWSVSFGVDPRNLDLRTRDPGFDARLVGNLARTWQLRGGLNGHVSGMFGGEAPRGHHDLQSGVRVDASRFYAGLTTGIGYEFRRGRRVSPYLEAGTGIYWERVRFRYECRSTNCDPLSLLGARESGGTSFGANAAVGLNLKLGSRSFFVEQRLHAFDVKRLDHGLHPLNIGIRF